VEENPVLVLFDLRGDFEEGEDDGRRLRLRQGGMLEGMCAQGVRQHIGRTSQKKPPRIRQKAGGRRTVAMEVILHGLDSIFAIAPGAIEIFVEPLRGGRRQRGHHKARVSARLHDFRLEHAPPGWRPGPGGIDALGIEAATGRRPLAWACARAPR
jgi:hypothetical protein